MFLLRPLPILRPVAAGLALAAFGMVFSAGAADLPARSAPPQPMSNFSPVATWSGPYVGAHAGWIGTELRRDNLAKASGDGLRGGIHAGYNVENSGFVLGVEADVSYTSVQAKGTTKYSDGSSSSADTKQEWMSTGRARVGYAMGDFLPYVTAGGALATLDDKLTSYGPAKNQLSQTNGSSTLYGWVVGAGIEYAITRNIGARLQYLHVELPSQSINSSGGNVSVKSDIVSSGVNYRF